MENKITSFRDIPMFISDGNYGVDVPISYFVPWVEREISEENLQLCPDFQRGHVWTEEQQIAFLEFFFKGGKTGRVIYFNNPSWHFRVPEGEYDEYVCVDGLQRVTAFKRFYYDEIPVFGSFFSEYTDTPDLSRHTIRININDLKKRLDVLNWYIEMNAGGTPHTNEEIQRVIKLRDACK